MANTVIVALPVVDEKVYRISSEKTPHLTLCDLGETVPAEDLATIMTYVQHAASELSPFGMSVDYRGTLGIDDADVLFFDKKSWGIERIADFRHYLLLNDTLKKAYDSITQYPEWTPHLTLGYPEKPAKKDESEYPGIHYVRFDRIAVWIGDSEGPEFRLKYDDVAYETVGAWSDMSTAEKGAAVANEIFHHGVKGMRWGVTTKSDGTVSVNQTRVRQSMRSSDKATTVSQRKPGTYVKAKGGQRQTASTDAVRTQAARRVAKKSTTDALSTKQLKDTIDRMRLEQEFAKLDKKVSRKGQSFVRQLFQDPRVRGTVLGLGKKAAGVKS